VDQMRPNQLLIAVTRMITATWVGISAFLPLDQF
jgi:hypothetical protein